MKKLAKHPNYKSEVANLIGGREKAFAELVLVELRKFGWQGATNIDVNGLGEIDILLWHPLHPSVGLIIEVKAVLYADDINEVASASKQFKHGQNQITRLITYLNRTPSNKWPPRLRDIVSGPISWEGFVLSPETEPALELDTSNVPVLSWVTLNQRLDLSTTTDACQMVNIMRQREWVSDVVLVEKKARAFVGEQTFILPFLIEPGDEQALSQDFLELGTYNV